MENHNALAVDSETENDRHRDIVPQFFENLTSVDAATAAATIRRQQQNNREFLQ
jgi:hypothetical protein